MKKVLILAFNFPPSTRTSANRAWAWAKYMHEFGYYPIIITRNWDVPIKKHEDRFLPSGDKIQINKYDTYEVHYLPYPATIRDRLFITKSNKLWFKAFSKIYTILEIFANLFSNIFIPYSNMQNYAEKILKEDASIEKMVVTVFPVYLYKFAHYLSKKYNLKWIADYRDDWNTSEINTEKVFLNKTIQFFESKAEKKWLKSASFVTSVSEQYVQKLEIFLNKKGKGVTLPNGFFEEEMLAYQNLPLYETFTITYNGTLFPSQRIEIFIEAIKKIIKNYPDHSIVINFPGSAAISEMVSRVLVLANGIENNIKITERIPKKQVLQMQARSHLLLMVGHKNITSIPSSKIYEYIGLEKKVLLCPSDHGIIEKTLSDMGLCLIADTIDETYSIIEQELLKYKSNKSIDIDRDRKNIHSRRNQTRLLSELLDII